MYQGTQNNARDKTGLQQSDKDSIKRTGKNVQDPFSRNNLNRQVKEKEEEIESMVELFDQIMKALHTQVQMQSDDKNLDEEQLPLNLLEKSMDYKNKEGAMKKLIEQAKEIADLHAKIQRDGKMASHLTRSAATDADQVEESVIPSKDQSTKGDDKVYQGQKNDRSTSPSRLDLSRTSQKNFDAVKSVLIQMKDGQQLKSNVNEHDKNQQATQSAEINKLDKELESLRLRLSELAGAKLAFDNPAITDLSDPNRPSKLREQYSDLYNKEWTDAFQKLSETKPKPSEEKIIQDLLCILHVKKESVQMSAVLARHLEEAVKLSSEITAEHVAKEFILNKEIKDRFGKQPESLSIYVKKCVRVCWLMKIQTPPVYIDFSAKPGDPFDKDMYREYTKKGTIIDFIVWPPLCLHEGGSLLVKGVAQGK